MYTTPHLLVTLMRVAVASWGSSVDSRGAAFFHQQVYDAHWALAEGRPVVLSRHERALRVLVAYDLLSMVGGTCQIRTSSARRARKHAYGLSRLLCAYFDAHPDPSGVGVSVETRGGGYHVVAVRRNWGATSACAVGTERPQGVHECMLSASGTLVVVPS